MPNQTVRRLCINVSAGEEDYTPGVNFVWHDLNIILSKYPVLEQVLLVFEDASDPETRSPKLANLVKSTMSNFVDKLQVLCLGNQCW